MMRAACAEQTWFGCGPVLVIGASGQLGSEFLRALRARGVPHRGAARTAAGGALAIDLCIPDEIASLVRAARPAVVINAAAYTAVDRAEQEADVAMSVNARAPGALAAVCAQLGALLVHFSSDYVFDGAAGRAYTEHDAVTPLGVYGRSKAAGEEAVCASGAPHLVFRTSWLYTPGGHNFVATMLRLFQGSTPVRVVDDQVGCPTWARLLAQAVTDLLATSPASRIDAARGLYHLCAGGHTSWYGFACAIRESATPPARAALERTDTASYGALAPRPAHSVLDCSKARAQLGMWLPPWREQLRAAMPEFIARSAGAC